MDFCMHLFLFTYIHKWVNVSVYCIQEDVTKIIFALICFVFKNKILEYGVGQPRRGQARVVTHTVGVSSGPRPGGRALLWDWLPRKVAISFSACHCYFI